MKLVSVLFLSLFFLSAQAVEAAETKSLVDLLDQAGKLQGTTYVYGKDLKGDVNLSAQPSAINKENVETYLSTALRINGYVRIPQSDTITAVINARDVRYSSLPLFSVSSDSGFRGNNPKYDYQKMLFQLKKYVDSSAISRSLRPFMSRYGRVIEMENNLIVVDHQNNLETLYKLIREFDRPLSQKEYMKIRKMRLTKRFNKKDKK